MEDKLGQFIFKDTYLPWYFCIYEEYKGFYEKKFFRLVKK